MADAREQRVARGGLAERENELAARRISLLPDARKRDGREEHGGRPEQEQVLDVEHAHERHTAPERPGSPEVRPRGDEQRPERAAHEGARPGCGRAHDALPGEVRGRGGPLRQLEREVPRGQVGARGRDGDEHLDRHDEPEHGERVARREEGRQQQRGREHGDAHREHRLVAVGVR